MEPDQVARVVREASRRALECYLGMCRLDSPWEVPEAFLATEAAKALAGERLRVAVEFKLDRAANAPTTHEIVAKPEVGRLQTTYAYLDVAILKDEADPWLLTIEGIIEFKKHSSLVDDAALIKFMIAEKHVMYGVLALLVVGASENRVINEAKRLTASLTEDDGWRQLRVPLAPKLYPPLPNTDIGDRWWDICCLVKP
jgi:hypothetical protein